MGKIEGGLNVQSNGEQTGVAFDGVNTDVLGPVYLGNRKRCTVWAFTTGTGWEVTLEVSPDGVHFLSSAMKLTPTASAAQLPEMPCHSVRATISYGAQPARKVFFVVLGD